MRRLLVISALLFVSSSYAQTKLQLAPPILLYQSAFIKEPTEVSILFNQPDASVHYTLNGSEPTSASPKYRRPILIRGLRTILKVKSFGMNYEPSETSTVEFVGGGKAVKRISYSSPHESYSKVPDNILYDNIGGLTQYGAGTWLGYNSDTVEINIALSKKEKVSSVLMDLLQDENSWIFLPEQIDVYFTDSKQQLALLESVAIPAPLKAEKRCVLKEIKLKRPVNTDKMKLVFRTRKSIPNWHAGKGQHGWFFIDEIKVY